MSADILVGNSHGLFVFSPVTDDGREWLEDNVADANAMDHLSASYYCDDRRLAMELAQGALNDGLIVE